MPKFRATLQLTELNGSDPTTALQSLEESLGRAGLTHWRVISVESDERLPPPPRTMPAARRQAEVRTVNFGGFLLAGAVAWALWFFSTLFE